MTGSTVFIISYSSQEFELSALNGFLIHVHRWSNRLGESPTETTYIKTWEEIVCQRKMYVVIP